MQEYTSENKRLKKSQNP